MSKVACLRCHTVNRPAARYCAHCGLRLESTDGGPIAAGRIRHPQPLSPPDGFRPCEQAADLYFRWEPAWGAERLLDTEGITIRLFNAGYALATAVLHVVGENAAGEPACSVEHTLAEWPRGTEQTLEVPSYEFAGSVTGLRVALASAEFQAMP